jgi:hypothetical protein
MENLLHGALPNGPLGLRPGDKFGFIIGAYEILEECGICTTSVLEINLVSFYNTLLMMYLLILVWLKVIFAVIRNMLRNTAALLIYSHRPQINTRLIF